MLFPALWRRSYFTLFAFTALIHKMTSMISFQYHFRLYFVFRLFSSTLVRYEDIWSLISTPFLAVLLSVTRFDHLVITVKQWLPDKSLAALMHTANVAFTLHITYHLGCRKVELFACFSKLKLCVFKLKLI